MSIEEITENKENIADEISAPQKAEKVYRKNIEEKFCDSLARSPKVHALYLKYREILVYLIVGVLNTIVSLGAFWIFAKLFLDATVVWQNIVLNTISWFVGVVFGYVMNRIYVFRSHNPNIMGEFLKFAGGRVVTWGSDTGMMLLMVNVLCWNEFFLSTNLPKVLVGDSGETIPKLISSVIVVVLNYIFSKLLVFRKKKDKTEESK